jgi:hypothetical protein
MKTDTQLADDVVAELTWESRDHALGIAVSAKEGVITLSGVVDSRAREYAAIQAVERVGGVRALRNRIIVQRPGTRESTGAKPSTAPLSAPGDGGVRCPPGVMMSGDESSRRSVACVGASRTHAPRSPDYGRGP